jgi:hypothetical protein
MQIKFTLNVIEVFDPNGDPIPTVDKHYTLAAEKFRETFRDSEHELVIDDGTSIMFEMEDIEDLP